MCWFVVCGDVDDSVTVTSIVIVGCVVSMISCSVGVCVGCCADRSVIVCWFVVCSVGCGCVGC